VLVIVDRFSKYVRYIPVNKDIDAVGLAETIFREVVLKVGVPNSFVTDRGSVFTSAYWSTVCWHLSVKRRLTTAWYPQSDGQTERQNQELETFLRIYCAYHQSDWTDMLETAEFAYNSKVHATTKKSPIEVGLGVVPVMPDGIRPDSGKRGDEVHIPYLTEPSREVPAAAARVTRLLSDRKEVTQYILHAQELQAKYYNEKHTPKYYAVGEQVLLSSKNIRTQRPNKKLSPKYLGPFSIIEKIGNQAYQLALPESMKRLHDVFNVVLLEPYQARPGDEPTAVRQEDIEQEPEWELEMLVSHRKRKGKDEYLGRWLGWSPEYDEWIAEEDLGNAQALLDEFKAQSQVVDPSLRRSARNKNKD